VQGKWVFRGMSFVVALFVAFLMSLVAAGGASAAIKFETQWQTAGKGEAAKFRDMAAGTEGSLYVLRGGVPRMVRFGPEGEVLGSWRVKAKSATAIAVDPDGNVLVAAKDGIERFDPAGERLRTWRLKGKIKDRGIFGFNPAAMAVAGSGQVYLVDEFNGRVIRLSADGRVLGSFGSFGVDPGQLYLPSDIAVGADGRVYVTELVEHFVQVFSPEGKFLDRLGREGHEPGKFQAASIVTTDRQGHLFVGDQILERIQVLTGDGAHIDQRGSRGGAPGRFSFMQAIAAGDLGELYVVDRRGSRIQKFRIDAEPHIPQAQVYLGIDNFIASARPGKKVSLHFRVINFGDLPAEGVRVCPEREHEFTGRIFGRNRCEFFGAIEPGRVVTFNVSAKIPRSERRGKLHIVKFRMRSSNAGGGPVGAMIYTDRRFDWLDDFAMKRAERSLGAGDQSVAMRLRARGAPGN